MFNLKVKENIKNAFTRKESLWNVLGALIAPLVYTVVPTVLNLQGWKGMATGFGLTVIPGVVFGNWGLVAGGVAVTVQHFLTTELNAPLSKALNNPLWRYMNDEDVKKTAEAHAAILAEKAKTEKKDEKSAKTAGLGNLQPGAQVISAANGQQLVAYPGVNGLYQSQVNGLYVDNAGTLNAYNEFPADNSKLMDDTQEISAIPFRRKLHV